MNVGAEQGRGRGESPGPTTAALVTPPARGGIAVILLTGPQTEAILGKVFRPRGAAPAVGRLALGRIVRDEHVLDEAIVVLLDRTGAAEINIHGGPHVARKVLTLLRECGADVVADVAADPSLAAPHGRWANPAIAREMLCALRTASTPLAVAAVTAQWSGGLSALAGEALRGLCGPSADRESPGGKATGKGPDPLAVATALRAAAAARPLMWRLLVPAEVVIAGPPNVGKSALANALVGRGISIVSDTPGTTRDWVRCLAEADGVPIWLTDTAGLWSGAEGAGGAPEGCVSGFGDLEAEAVRRAWQRIASADLIVCVSVGRGAEYAELLERIRGAGNVIDVAGKCDLAEPGGPCDLAVSGRTCEGIESLRRTIRERLGFGGFDQAAPMAFTDRQAELLVLAADALDRTDPWAARAALGDLLAYGRSE